ncbi:MAG: S26 family signal peptidase [Phycisphaerae bacterium]|nr:S26 family signal peptidase [Phycisphaerae bacterium]
MSDPLHSPASAHPAPSAETNVVDTLQSLTVAFALAMTVRSFVTEGFVIPTGSMAPTLAGAHFSFRSPETAYEYSIDFGPVLGAAAMNGGQLPQGSRGLVDPMINPLVPIAQWDYRKITSEARMGDRVLVLKYLYAFSEPQRWDVVVFKNPTDPVGDTQNYIKRLVGIENEQLLTVDGDVWTAPLGAPLADFRVQRKPEHVQRAVWQPVHDSDYVPVDPQAMSQRMGRSYDGPPWVGEHWDTSGRAYHCDTAEPTTLHWRAATMPIDDRCGYNALQLRETPYPVSDIRVRAAVEAEDITKWSMDLQLEARSHTMRWQLNDGNATLLVVRRDTGAIVAEETTPCRLPAQGASCDIECWHVDHSLSLWINGTKMAELVYDHWTPEDRVRFSFPGLDLETYRRTPVGPLPDAALLAWNVAGSPVTFHHVAVDRDLYYRPNGLAPGNQCPTNGPFVQGLAFGSDLNAPAQLEADQFLMMGDNSAYSRDGRVWGRPHPLVQAQLGETSPFIVPRELLLGKAWCVYFPAPLPVRMPDGRSGKAIVPDIGSNRFIR